jgi:glutamyl/glutaminyl-tRNA synthetase
MLSLLEHHDPPIHLDLPSIELINLRKAWFARLIALFLPVVDRLDQLPVQSAFIFGSDPSAARLDPENASILAADSARTVLGELASRVRTHSQYITPKDFKDWMNEIKIATGVKDQDLFHPVRIALTGAHSGRDFDRLIPLIEDGAALGLPIPGIRDRLEQFVGV